MRREPTLCVPAGAPAGACLEAQARARERPSVVRAFVKTRRRKRKAGAGKAERAAAARAARRVAGAFGGAEAQCDGGSVSSLFIASSKKFGVCLVTWRKDFWDRRLRR